MASVAYQSPEMGLNDVNTPAGYEPGFDDEQTIKLANTIFAKNKASRRAYDDRWLDYYKMFRGNQWKEPRPSYRHSDVINLIFRAIQSDVPILTDGMVRPEFIPQDPADFELSQILNDILASDWAHGNWDFKITENIYDSHFYGIGIGCLGYDSKAAYGQGRIIYKSDDPFYCYPDPYCRDINEEANNFVYAEPVPVDRLKREYPEQAKFIKPDIMDMATAEKVVLGNTVRYVTPSDNNMVPTTDSPFDLKARDETLKLTVYVHDLAYVEEEVTRSNEVTGESEQAFVQKLKYPNGRKIVTCSGVLCEDGPLEYDDKKFPYLKVTNYIDPRNIFGISEIEQLESPQRIFNKLVCFTLDVLTLMGNPIWVLDNTSGVDADNIYSRPGLVIEKEPGTEVKREEGVQLQPFVLQLIDRMKLWFDDISGSTESSRGVAPSGVTAASAIEALQSATHTRLRQKTRNIGAFMQQFGQMYISRVFQYYDTPRVFRVTNTEGAARYFKFHVDKVEDPVSGEVSKIARVRHYVQGEDGGQYLGPENEYQVQGEFDVTVSMGSSLPFEKSRIESQSLSLFDRGIIDAEEVLKNINYPNAESVLQRMAQKAAMQAQMLPQQPGAVG